MNILRFLPYSWRSRLIKQLAAKDVPIAMNLTVAGIAVHDASKGMALIANCIIDPRCCDPDWKAPGGGDWRMPTVEELWDKHFIQRNVRVFCWTPKTLLTMERAHLRWVYGRQRRSDKQWEYYNI